MRVFTWFSPSFWSSPVAFRNLSKRLIHHGHSSGLKLNFSGGGTWKFATEICCTGTATCGCATPAPWDSSTTCGCSAGTPASFGAWSTILPWFLILLQFKGFWHPTAATMLSYWAKTYALENYTCFVLNAMFNSPRTLAGVESTNTLHVS